MSEGKLHPNWGTILGVCVGLAVHLVATVWWASGITSEVATNTRRNDSQDEAITEMSVRMTAASNAAIRTETELQGIGRDISRVEATVQANSALMREFLRELGTLDRQAR